MKSQRPSRRKQELQVARPAMWPVSACQPNIARIKASRLRGGAGGARVGDGGWEDGAVLGAVVDACRFGCWRIEAISGI